MFVCAGRLAEGGVSMSNEEYIQRIRQLLLNVDDEQVFRIIILFLEKVKNEKT